jgi:hypothetical protein
LKTRFFAKNVNGMTRDGEIFFHGKSRVGGVRKKRVRVKIEWTDVAIEPMPIAVNGSRPFALLAFRGAKTGRGNYNRATRSGANVPRRMVQILTEAS